MTVGGGAPIAGGAGRTSIGVFLSVGDPAPLTAQTLEQRDQRELPLAVDRSEDTWQNAELSLPCLREALAMGLPLVAVSKWYHLRAVYCLHTQLPEAVPLYAIGWEPVYAGKTVPGRRRPGRRPAVPGKLS